MLLEHQTVRYGIVGMVSVSVDFIILNFSYLKLNFPLFWAVLFGFVASVMVGYFFHSRWTFRYNTQGKELSKISGYLFMTAIALAITEGIVFIATEKFGIHYNISKTIALGFAILFTYIASKYWVFREGTPAYKEG